MIRLFTATRWSRPLVAKAASLAFLLGPLLLSAAGSPPVNDPFANRQVLPAGVTTASGSNAGATREAGEPAHGGSGGKSVWWSWQATVSGPAAVSTAGSTFDTLLGVYTGTSLAGLTEIKKNDDENQLEGIFTSRVTFEAVAGTFYQIAVDGSGGAEGTVQLRIEINGPPGVSLTSPANGATFAVKTPINLCAAASDPGGQVSFVEFYAGATLIGSSASPPYCLTWSNAPAGQHILAARATDNSGLITTSSPIQITVELRNDNFSARTPIPSTNNSTVTVQGSNLGATKENGEPDHRNFAVDRNPGGRSVWWSWRAPAAGRATIQPSVLAPGSANPESDSYYNTLVGVYTGSTLGTLIEVPLVVSGNRVTFDAVAGTEYQIAVDGLRDSSGVIYEGDITLTVIISQPPSVTLITPVNDTVFKAGTNIILQAVASDSDGAVVRVDFFRDGILIGSDSTKPYSNIWTKVPEGNYVVTAVATDDTGTASASEPARIVVRASPGEPLWSVSPGGASLSTSAAIGEDGTIYLGSSDKNLYALNPDGTTKWSFTTGGGIESSPALGPNQTIYIAANDGALYAVEDRGTNAILKWKFQTGNFTTASPAIGADGTVYLASWDHHLYAINPETGGTNWLFDTGGRIIASPAVAFDGAIYIGSYDTNKFYAIHPDGTKRWEYAYAPDDQTFTSPAIAPDGTIYVGTIKGVLLALSPDGTKHWDVTPALTGFSLAIARDGMLYFGAIGMAAYHPDGTLRTNWPVGFFRATPTLAADGTIYAGSEEGTFYALNPDGTKVWEFAPGVPFGSHSAAVARDGTIYIADNNGKFYALKGTEPLAPGGWPKFRRNAQQTGNALVKTGDELWELPVGPGESIAPAIGVDGTIYVSSAEKLSAVKPDGRTLWELPLPGYSSPALGADQTIYVGGRDGKLYAVAADGTNKWTFNVVSPIFATPAIAGDGTIIFGTSDGRLYAVDQNGTEKWRFTTGIDIQSSPALGADGVIYFASADGHFYAINRDGTRKWDLSLGAGTISSPAIGPDGTIYIGSNEDQLQAIDPAGRVKWSVAQAGALSSPAVGPDGTIYVGSVYHGLKAFNPDGSQKWAAIEGQFIRSSPALAGDGTIYVGSDDGHLYALDSNGAVVWQLQIGPKAELRLKSPTIAFDGTVYISSDNTEKIYAIKGTARLAHQGWPKFHRNGRQTGNAAVLAGDPLWSFFTGWAINASPALGGDGRIVLPAGDRLYSFNAEGDLAWEAQMVSVSGFGSSPAIGTDGTIYVASEDYSTQPPSTALEAFSEQGDRKWFTRLAGLSHNLSPALGSDGTLYMGTRGGFLYALDPHTGSTNWAYPVSGEVLSSPALATDGTIYFGANTNQVIALDSGGHFRWQFSTVAFLSSFTPALGADGTVYIGDIGAELYAISPDGQKRWSRRLGYNIYCSPIVGPDETIYIHANEEKSLIHALDPATGTNKWRLELPVDYGYSTPLLGADGMLYVAVGSRFYGLRTAQGLPTVEWEFGAGDRIVSSPLLSGGTIYFGSEGHYFYALKASGSLAGGPWPMFRKDPAHTGQSQTAPRATNNDNFASRATLRGAIIATGGDNSGATREAAEPLHDNKPGGKSLWWSWTAPSSGRLTVSTAGSAFDTLLAVYSGTSLASLVPLASDDDRGGSSTSEVTLSVTQGLNYEIAVDGFGGSSGNIRLALHLNTPPTASITNLASGSVFTAPASILIAADALDKDGAVARLEFYVDGILLATAANAPYAYAWTNVPPGSYSVTVKAIDREGISVTSVPVIILVTPPNDDLARAIPLSGTSATANGSNVNATQEPREPQHAQKAGGKSVWWTWTAPQTGFVTLSTFGSGFDTLLGLYTGNSMGSLVEVASDDDSGGASTSELIAPVTANLTYQIAVDGFAGNAGDVHLTLDLAVPPTVSISSPASGATFTAPANLTLVAKALDQDGTISRVDFSHDGSLIGSVTTGPNNNYTLVWSNVVAGTYQVVANAIDNSGNRATSAPVTLRVLGTAAAPLILRQPENASVAAGADATFSATVEGTPPLSYQWRFGGNNIPGANQPLLVISNAQPANAGNYSLVVSNQAGSVTTRTVSLAVVLPPKIVSLSSSQEVPAGGAVTFSVTATGTTPLRFQWRLNGVNIPAATSADFRLANVDAASAGTYSVAVSNSAGTAVSSDILLTVRGGSAPAGPPSLAREDFWITDGPVYAMVQTNGIIYLGGDFNYVGPNLGGGAAFDRISGIIDQSFPKVDGEVDAVLADGNGGWFIGGNFNSVGGFARANVAHLQADKGVDPAWAPEVNGPVRALALSGNVLYLGGQFNTVNGAGRLNLAALDAASGDLTAWQPAADGAVQALAIAGQTVYAGGVFSTVGDRTRKRLAAIDASTGIPTAWNPNVFGTAVYALAISGHQLYAGGQFYDIGGRPRQNLAALDLDSAAASSWDPSPDNQVRVLAIAEGTVYAGGFFTAVAGQPRNYLAAIDGSTGLPTPWDPSPDNAVFALAAGSDTVYVGGQFSAIGGATRQRLAALNRQDSRARDWDPSPNDKVFALAADGPYLYAGGQFISAGGKVRNYAAAIDTATGAANEWNPDANLTVRALALAGNRIYLGGEFTSLGGELHERLASVDRLSGQPDPGNLGANGTVHALAAGAQTIYVGGSFTELAGQTRNRIAALDAESGGLNSWNPNASDTVRALALTARTVLAGGEFTMIGTTGRNRVAAWDLATGQLTSWNPNANAAVTAFAVSGTVIFAGGAFESIGGHQRHRLAALDELGDATAWNPGPGNVTPNDRQVVNALSAIDNSVYAGGIFEEMGGQPRRNAALLDATTGQALPWNPSPDGEVLSLASTGNELFGGGWFATAGGQFRPFFGAFSQVGFPSILVQPASQTVAQNSRTILTVSAGGREPLLYQWQLNGAPIPGETNATLELPDSQIGQAGLYSVTVSNALGAVVSSAAQLTVLAPPVIVTQPAGQTVAPGANVTFTVVASGSEPLTYQWRLNGANLPGATGPVLTLRGVQPVTAGSYSVAVGNLVGAVNSAEAVLVVTTATPLLLSDRFADRVIVTNLPAGSINGNNTTATAEPGEPRHAGKRGGKSLWLSWRAPATGVASFNTLGSSFDTLLAVYSGTTLAGLIPIASDEDSGGFFASSITFNAVAGEDYQVAVDGFAGATGNVTLNWRLEATADEEVPRIFRQPQDQTAAPGGKVTLTVGAQSAGPLRYQWLFKGSPIEGATGPALIIPNLQEADVGVYSVNVFAGRRVVTSEKAVIEIGPEPQAVSEDKLQDLLPDEDGLALASGFRRRENFAAPVAGSPGTQVLDNYGATKEKGEPNHGGVLGGASRLFKLKIPNDGQLIVDTIGSDIDTVLAVYTGTAWSNAKLVASDDNGAPDGIRSRVRIPVVRGDDYLLAADGVKGAVGHIKLNWKLGTPPRLSISPASRVARTGEAIVFQAEATGTPRPIYQWRFKGSEIPGATNATLTVNNVQLVNAGNYSVVAQNFIGSVASTNASLTIVPTGGWDPVPLEVGGLWRWHFSGVSGRSVVIQASTNLVDWQAVSTNSVGAAGVDFRDLQQTNYLYRFYRAQQ